MFKYTWSHDEANFGPPLKKPVPGGGHITFEIVLKFRDKYVALRRDSIPGHEAPPHAKKHPGGLLYFCHDLIRYGEDVEHCIKRIVKTQTGVGVKSYELAEIESGVQKKDGQWAFVPHIVAKLARLPKAGRFGNQIYEIITFTKEQIPGDFAWWSKKDLADFLSAF